MEFKSDNDDIQVTDKLGGNALNWAVQLGNYRFVKPLILAGVDINHESGAGKTPLMQAIGDGNQKLVEMFLSYGADVNHQCKKGGLYSSALVFAIHRRPHYVLPLIKAGIDMDTVDRHGVSMWTYLSDKVPDCIEQVRVLTSQKDNAKLKEVLPLLSTKPKSWPRL